jgi:curli biogenesis system outer membrane secretion channel CsgG
MILAAPVQAEVKKSISVAPIQWTCSRVGWIHGQSLHAQIITELGRTGRYRVVERENLGGIIREQDLGTSGRTRKGSSPKVGDIEGSQLMIKCVITDAEMEQRKGGRGSIGGIRLGGKKTTYRITMDVRIYDAQTSIIQNTVAVTAEQVVKGKGGGIRIGGLGLGGNKEDRDTSGAITRDLIQQAIRAIDQESKKVSWSTKVITLRGDKAVIRGGLRDGLEVGMKLKVYALGEPIIDEDTGEVLDEGEETEVGEITLSQVKEKVAFGTKSSGKPAEKGNVVRLITN